MTAQQVRERMSKERVDEFLKNLGIIKDTEKTDDGLMGPGCVPRPVAYAYACKIGWYDRLTDEEKRRI